MQASVHRFDPDAGAGAVLLDDGTELPFEREAFDRSGLRLVRVGQRLTVDIDDERVVALRLQGI
jgi:2-phospho-L-lactate/phosphoenolpyruvate guanylyltransferase